jgi:hypothetical protein
MTALNDHRPAGVPEFCPCQCGCDFDLTTYEDWQTHVCTHCRDDRHGGRAAEKARRAALSAPKPLPMTPEEYKAIWDSCVCSGSQKPGSRTYSMLAAGHEALTRLALAEKEQT